MSSSKLFVYSLFLVCRQFWFVVVVFFLFNAYFSSNLPLFFLYLEIKILRFILLLFLFCDKPKIFLLFHLVGSRFLPFFYKFIHIVINSSTFSSQNQINLLSIRSRKISFLLLCLFFAKIRILVQLTI
jgi:hypothetical protein